MKPILVIITILYLGSHCFGQSNNNPVNKDSSQVCKVDSESPHFPGGNSEMMKFISDNLSLPDSVIDSALGKKIFLKMVIDTTGERSQIIVLKGINKTVDNEILRIFSIMPEWVPGIKEGKKISEEFVLPIKFGVNEKNITK